MCARLVQRYTQHRCSPDFVFFGRLPEKCGEETVRPGFLPDRATPKLAFQMLCAERWQLPKWAYLRHSALAQSKARYFPWHCPQERCSAQSG